MGQRKRAILSLSPAEAERILWDWEFWARDKQIEPEGDWYTWLIHAGRGFGKALDLRTPIPTPDGWTTMGELSVGDEVLDENGRPCRVTFATGVQLNRTCYRVTFDDGASVIADAEHRWLTWCRRARKAEARAKSPTIGPSVRTTEEIRATLKDSGERNHAIPTTKPLALPSADLLVDPYVLGAWLGDGDTRGAVLTTSDAEMFDILRERGCEVGAPKPDSRSSAVRVQLGARKPMRGADGRMLPNGSLHSRLRDIGVLGNKHIPPKYLRASEEQRRELLKGLMDTDGSVTPGGHCEFSGCSERLCRDVFELCVSLGFKPTIAKSAAKLNGRVVGDKWRITFTPREAVFRLQRKLARQRFSGGQAERTRRRYVVSVEPVESVPVRCITVDSPSHLFLCGREMIPTHNTRTGAETVRKWAWEKRFKQILIAGRTAGDVRSILIEGPSGILATSPPWFRPTYEPSKRQLTWPNGVVGVIRYGDAPDGFRGFEGGGALLDELFHWGHAEEAFDNLMFGMREQGDIRIVIPCTPLPTKLCREICADDDTVVTQGSTFENKANLSPKALAKLKKKYSGTRVGRQELEGEILSDNPAAQWTYELIHRLRRGKADLPEMVRIVVAVDPAASHGPKSDETGIVVAGLGVDGHVYILDDLSLRGKPGEWSRVVANAYVRWKANLVVAEKNNGGDMVESTLRSANAHLPVRLIHAKKGKRTRAEPVAVLYEQGLVHHVWDVDDALSPAANGELYPFSEMERQMVSVDVNDPKDHDDRLDAAVYAVTELAVDGDDPLADLEAMAG